MKHILKGSIHGTNFVAPANGHSQVRIGVKGFGEVILSAPREALQQYRGLPDDAEATVTVEIVEGA